MDTKDKNTLQKNLVFITENLEVSPALLDYMTQEGVFTSDHNERFSKQAERDTARAVASELVRFLRMRGPKAFGVFIEALSHSGQGFIAERLSPNLAKDCIEKNTSSSSKENKLVQASPVDNTAPTQYSYSNTQQPVAHPTACTEDEQLAPRDPDSRIMEVKVTNVDPTNPHIQKLLNDPGVYRMDQEIRGRTVIIQNDYFTVPNLDRREGSLFDEINITALFKSLNFHVVTWKNLTLQELEVKLQEERELEDHKSANAFVMVVLSHGLEHGFYTNCGAVVSVEEVLVKAFDGKHCKHLVGKPKLFLIQACQGKDDTDGVPVHDGPGEASAQVKGMSIDEPDTNPIGENYDQSGWKTSHEKADIIIAYATVPGYKSWRMKDSGTWFIRTFIKVMCETAHEDHLMDILIKVVDLVDQKATGGMEKYKQLPRIVAQLKKKLYFFPGYTKTKLK